MQIVLASTSPYRRTLLNRLQLAFETDSPHVDESPRTGEPAPDLVRRLAATKAHCVAERHPGSLIIGADQVAVLDGAILGKPGGQAANVRQLLAASGRHVVFLTGLCVLNAATGNMHLDVVPVTVEFRILSEAQARAYVEREKPFDCAGGFKSEGLGGALFKRLHAEDPSALVGLPLFRLVEMLAAEGVDVLTRASGSR